MASQKSLVADFAAATVLLPVLLLLLILLILRSSFHCVKAVDPNAPELSGYHTVKWSGDPVGMFKLDKNPFDTADTRIYYHVTCVPGPPPDIAPTFYMEMEANSQKLLKEDKIIMSGLCLNEASAAALLEGFKTKLGSKKYIEERGLVSGHWKYILLKFFFAPPPLDPEVEHFLAKRLLAEHEVRLPPTAQLVAKFGRSMGPLLKTPFYLYWVVCVEDPSPAGVNELFRLMTADAEDQLLIGEVTMAGIYLNTAGVYAKRLFHSIKEHLETTKKKFKEEIIEPTESNEESFVVVKFPLAPPLPNAQELRRDQKVLYQTPGTSENSVLIFTFGRQPGLPNRPNEQGGDNQEGYYYRVECHVENPPPGTVKELLQRMHEDVEKQMLVGGVIILGFYMNKETASRLGAPHTFRSELAARKWDTLEEETVVGLDKVEYFVFKFPL